MGNEFGYPERDAFHPARRSSQRDKLAPSAFGCQFERTLDARYASVTNDCTQTWMISISMRRTLASGARSRVEVRANARS